MLRGFCLLVIAVVLVSAVVGSAASLEVNGGTIQVFSFPVHISFPTSTPTPTPLAATVDLKPESLEKKSQGDHVTAFVYLPGDYDGEDVDLSTVHLCRGTAPCGTDGIASADTPKVGKGKGAPDLTVTFDRGAVIGLLADVPPPATVTFTVSGTTKPPTRAFVGSDTLRIVDPIVDRNATATPTSNATPTATGSPRPTATATPVATATGSPATPTATPPAGATPGSTATATEMPTGAPTTVPTAAPTPTPTYKPLPTATASPPATATPTSRSSPSPTTPATATRVPPPAAPTTTAPPTATAH